MNKNSPFHPKYYPTWLLIGFLRLVALLPYPVLMALGKGIGILLNKYLIRRRHVVEVNIRLCFPELSTEEQDKLIRDTMIATSIGFFETIYSWWVSDEEYAKRAELQGLELLDQAKAEGRGVLLIGAHFTTLDLNGRTYGLYRKACLVYRPQNNKAFDYMIDKGRRRYVLDLITKREMRKMVKYLKQGDVVWYAPDQDFGRKNSIFVPFFGQQAATLSTIKQLTKLTNAKVMFYQHHRVGDRYIGKIINPFEGQFGDDDVENTRLMNLAIENMVREHPEQYMWVHQRFKTRPNPEDPKLYIDYRKQKRAKQKAKAEKKKRKQAEADQSSE